MVPTHQHADGGFYIYVGPQLAKGDGPDSEWVDGVEYKDSTGKKFWTTEARWADRFEPITVEQMGETQAVELKEDDEVIGSFSFEVHEAGDVRFMLIKAGPQPNNNLAPQQILHIRRVLNAMAEAVTAGLHVRDHDFPDLIGDVNAFHAKFGQEYTGKPRRLDADLHDFRVKFHEEETHEYRDEYSNLLEAIERSDRRDIINCLELQLDALCDAVWVVLGTADLQFGRKAFIEAWRRVVKANMAKIRKDLTADGDGHEDSGRAPKYDIVKPAGWVAPDHRDLVTDNAIFDELFGEAPALDHEVESNTFNEGV